MKKIVLAMVFVLLAGATAQAQSVPPLVNYQGMLTDAAGKPQTGTKKLEFNLYDAATGGNKVWGPQVFNSVPLMNGMFNVILGTTDANGKSIADAFSAKDRYLGMKVDGGTELVPRQQILSTPFAIQAFKATDADHALKADVAETVQGTNLYVDPNNGNTGIGTSSPKYKLEVVGEIYGTGGRSDCGIPYIEMKDCRGYSNEVFQACSFRICNSCGCGEWNPGGTQMIRATPGW